MGVDSVIFCSFFNSFNHYSPKIQLVLTHPSILTQPKSPPGIGAINKQIMRETVKIAIAIIIIIIRMLKIKKFNSKAIMMKTIKGILKRTIIIITLSNNRQWNNMGLGKTLQLEGKKGEMMDF